MWINRVLWIIYIALLAVLLPHTAWAFKQFEPEGWTWVGWVAAFAFEAAIAAFTWRLKQLIETTPKYRKRAWLKRLKYRYLSPYGLGLFAALIISAVANWAHAVEFGQEFAVFARYSVPTWAFSVGFGAILPLISLLFARVLAEAQDTEEEANQDLVEAKETIKELRQRVRESEDARNKAEQEARDTEERAEADRIAAEEKAETERIAAERKLYEAEQKFAAMSELAAKLFAAEKKQRILAARERWPQLPAGTIAIIADSSPSYVSEVLSEDGEHD